jgi:lipoprotein NlpD
MNALRWNPDYHTVRSGETLYSIAMQYNLDTRHLIMWNDLGSDGRIRQGQKLRLNAPQGGVASRGSSVGSGAAPVANTVLPAPRWRWPAKGPVIAGYGATAKTESGIRIGGNSGDPVLATAGGEVVYAGDGLRSYGLLLIIKHNETWLSAYGFNSTLLTGEGDRVEAGQVIAEMGEDRAGTDMVHFEIRRNGKPVNPTSYLPAR